MKKSTNIHFPNIKNRLSALAVAACCVCAPSAWADTEIEGTVIDAATGAVLPGARVTVVDGQATAMTGDKGRFKLTAPDARVMLRVEAPGFSPVLVPLRGQKSIYVRLSSDQIYRFYGNDNVLSPYSKSTAIHSQAGEIAGDQSVADLQGQLFGITRSGMPASGHAVFVNGLHSINTSSQPLYVVDGVEWSASNSDIHTVDGHFDNPLALISPDDIASVSVIKNGTSLYGAKGANGVILIETKRATSEATEIEAWASVGFRTRPKSIPMMDASQYRLYVTDVMSGMFDNSSYVNRYTFLNDDPTSITYKATHNNTDWLNLTTQRGLMMNYGISVRGGDDRALYGFSLGYTKDDGNVRETAFERLNIRFNSDINLWAGFKLRFDVAFAQSTWNIFDDGINDISSPLYLSMIKSPLYHPNVISNTGDVTLSYSDVDELGVGNPLSILDLGIGQSRNYRFNINAAPQYKFNDQWAIKGLVAYSFDKIKDNSFIPNYGVADVNLTNPNGEIYATMRNRVQSLMNRHTSFMAKLYGQYTPLHDHAHNLDLRLGARFRNDSYNISYGQGYNTSSDQMNALGNTTATLRETRGIDAQWRNMAWFLTGEYAYLKRYIIGVDATMETSNRFGKNAPGALHLGGVSWGIFPSVNAAWVFSSEDFMSGADFINFAKLRLSWGMAGNDNLPDYASRTYFSSIGLLGQAYGLQIENIGNDRLKWETTSTWRAGLDMSLFNNRWSFNLDFYKSKTTDLLVRKQLNEEAGLQYFWSNGGQLDNTGVNFSTTVRAIDMRDWKLDVGASIGHYKNKVSSLSDGDFITDIDNAQILTAVGQPLGVFYGYKTNGVFSTTEEAKQAGLAIRNANGSLSYFEAGDMRFADNGDGIINDEDRQVIGDPNPDVYGNINLRLSWKRFTLGTMFTYSIGNDVYNALRANLESGSDIYNQSVALADRWVANGQKAEIPRATYGDPMGNSRFSDRWIEDGSYLRWKSLQLSYDIPVRTSFLQGVQVWASVTNLLTFTKYLGSDPEFFDGTSPLGLGIDNGLTPSSREFNFGVKINL